MKKLLFLFLVNLLPLMVCAYDFSDNGLFYNLKSDGTLEVTGLATWTTRADIPSSLTINGVKYRVTSIGDYAFEGRSDITYLSIQYSMKSIGKYAFRDCGSNMTVNIANLKAWCEMELGNEHSSPLSSAGKVLLYDVETTSIDIPEDVTSIGNYTFYQCRSIKSLTIPASVAFIGSSTFEDCTGLTSVSLSEGLESIGGSAFEGCTGLSSITIPSTMSEISINAFNRCTNLNDITSLIRSPFPIDYSAFCTYDTATLTVPRGTRSVYQNTAGWRNFSRITDGASSNEFSKSGISYIVTSSNTVAVKSIDSYLKSVDIPSSVSNGGSSYQVTALAERSFEGRSDISYLVIPGTITSIGEYAFIDCGSNIEVNIKNLSAWCNVTLGNEHSSPLSSAKTLYVDGVAVSNLTIPNGVPSISNYAFYQCRCISSLTIPTSVTSIGSSTFEDCTGLMSVTLSEGLESIGGSAFEGCTGLSAITIPSTVSEISINAFNRCTNLNNITSLIRSPFPIDYSAFCTYDTATLTVPRGTKSVYQNTAGWSYFSQITDGTSSNEFSKSGINYIVTSSNTVAVKSIDSYLKSVDIPESVSNEGSTYQVTSLADRSFEGRSDISYMVIPGTITYIGEYAFIDCGSNIDVNIKNLSAWCNVTLGNEHSSPLSSAKTLFVDGVAVSNLTIANGVPSISNYAFYQCRCISSLTVPTSVTSIGSSTFEDCTGLTSVTLSEGLESIGGSAFEGCTGLSAITIPSTVSEIQINAFQRCSNLNNITSMIKSPFAIDGSVFNTYSTATLTVPYGTRSAYMSTAGWNQFSNIVEDDSGQSVVVTANNYSREYGEENPSFDYTTSGADLKGTPTISCGATKTSPVGTYTITIEKGSVTNGNVTFVNGTLTITKAPLTVTAMDCSREQGQANPTFEVTYSGFKNNETEAVLDRKPTISTTATESSAPGQYVITVSGGEAMNYDFKYVNGILTVTEKDEVVFAIDGTTYQGSKTDKTAIVKSVDKSLKSLEIPASVSYDGLTYQVTGIADNAFNGSNMAALIWNVETALPSNAFSNASIGSNFLLYVKSASYAPSSVKNVVENGAASSIVLSDDGGQFYCPQAFMAKSISYSHNYNMETGDNGKGWETLALPFDVQKITHRTNGEIIPFAAYSSGSSQKPFWLANFVGNSFYRTSAVLANEPYIVAMPNSSKYRSEYNLSGDVTFSSENVQVPMTPSFSGTFLPAFATVEKSSSVYALNVNNRYVKYSGNFDAGSHFISNLRDVRPFEAYILEDSTRGFFEINFNDGTTGIMDMQLYADEDREITIYTLNGQLVDCTNLRDFDLLWSRMPRGVYIVNGMKRIK